MLPTLHTNNAHTNNAHTRVPDEDLSRMFCARAGLLHMLEVRVGTTCRGQV